ncbi:MAG: eIF2A-related protein [Oligoflexus sp.]
MFACRKSMMALFMIVLGSFSAWADDKSTIMIKIDSPEFRKVLTATPMFFVDKSVTSEDAKAFAEKGPQELARLLNFSGLFNVISDKAYVDGLPNISKRYNSKDDADWIVKQQGLKAEDWDFWKTVGVESLTIGTLKQDAADGLVLSIKTYDVIRRQELLAKQFQKITDQTATIRKYADFILEAYTGKPGIFQSKLAFVGRRAKNSVKQIYFADFDGSNPKAITSGKEPHLSPAWSPDGRYITYTTFENRSPNIYMYDTQTGSTRKLTSSKEGVTSGANWAPNGKLIAFSSSRGGETDIHVINPSGTERKMLIKGSSLDVDPKFSPDGKYLAFVSGRFGNPHIFVANLAWDGDTKVRVTGDKRLTYAGWYNSTPDWSRESDKIAFGGYDRDINRYDIFIMNPDGTKLERLTLKNGDNESPSWSPNSQLIVFQSNRVGDGNQKGPGKLWIMSRDGSHQRPLDVPGLFEALTPTWSPQLR